MNGPTNTRRIGRLICGFGGPMPTDDKEFGRIARSLIANGHESAYYVMITRFCIENGIPLTDRF